ncbi:MAG TPA: HAD family phosphatase [Spirochaetota bacterium]|nr:HAD family phosphatase [Spirochaetota bacterium]
MDLSTIIFDIGNVIIRFKPEQDLRHRYTGTELSFIRKNIILTDTWLNLDKGLLTNKTAIAEISRRFPSYKNIIKSFLTDCYETFTLIPATARVINSLKQRNYQLLLLSNYHRKGFEEYLLKKDIFSLFDGGIISYKEGIIKPDPAIYQLLIMRYQFDPGKALFIDDTLENIAAAQDSGLNCIHLPRANKLEAELKARQIL